MRTHQASEATVSLQIQGDFELCIGSLPENDIILEELDPLHARLYREGDRLFIKDCDSTTGSWINGRRVPSGRWTELTRFDEVFLGETLLELSPKLFIGRDRITVDSTQLYFTFRERNRQLCSGIFLRAKPGTLTAILGPAGCGKTIFLNLIGGHLKPTAGNVLYGEQWDPILDASVLRSYVGYVPQGEALHSELTVLESLNFRLRLDYPDMAAATRRRLIHSTSLRLGFAGNRSDRFLSTLIGSSESRKRGLSGGERRRANIAHELINRPLVLLLDEPTSGLSSSDADRIIRLLHSLSRDELITVVATIHQPSRTAFDLFDDLILLGHGGNLAYCGPASRALEYVENVTGEATDSTNPADYLLDMASEAATARVLSRTFSAASTEAGYRPLEQTGRTKTSDTTSNKRQKAPLWPRQLVTLLCRNLVLMYRDRLSLVLGILQAPLIGVLVLLAFSGFPSDNAEMDRTSTIIHLFDQIKAPVERQNGTIRADSILKDARRRAEQLPNVIGPVTAQSRAGIYFVLVAASIWFGVLSSSREIVAESAVNRREFRSCTRPLPYLLSKAMVQFLMRFVETGVLASIVGPMLLQLTLDGTVQLWLVLWLTAVCATCVGLLVSSLAPTERFALTAVPLILIPQSLFGGLLRPEANIPGDVSVPKLISSVTVQRWGFQAALDLDSDSNSVPVRQVIRPDFESRYWELNLVRFERTSLQELLFKWNRERAIGPLSVLCGIALVALLFAFVILKWRYAR